MTATGSAGEIGSWGVVRWFVDYLCTFGDGRRLAVQVSGNPTRTPGDLPARHAGKPGGAVPAWRVLYELGVRLVSFDRPGYGAAPTGSQGARVADVARDVEAIADELGLAEFAVVGRSGGGPHALACAACCAAG